MLIFVFLQLAIMAQHFNGNGNDLPRARDQPAEAPEEDFNEYFLDPAPVEEPPQGERRIHLGRLRRRQIMAQYVCNTCGKYARGAVITICGHIFCWGCLWPQLANNPEPKCPRCETHLVVHNEIVPMFGSPDDNNNNVAEPGAVPRPSGIIVAPRNDPNPRQQEPVDIHRRVAAEFPRITLVLKCLSVVQVVCIILIGLLYLFLILI